MNRITLILSTFLLLIFFSSNKELAFRFSSLEEGSNNAFPKTKAEKFNFGEDSLSTSPRAMAISDGVSSCIFTTKFWSQLIAYQFQNFVYTDIFPVFQVNKIQTSQENLTLQKMFEDQIENLRIEYKSTLQNSINNWENKNKKMVNQNPKNTQVSATMIGAYLKTVDDKNMIQFIQFGDSLGIVFSNSYNQENDNAYEKADGFYFPSFYRPEMTYSFNYPVQIGNLPDEIENIIEYKQAPIDINDLVLLGSDGLFDNMHFWIICLIPNMLVRYAYLLKNDQAKVEEALSNFMKFYAEIFVQRFEMFNQSVTNKKFHDTVFLAELVKDPDWKKPSPGILDMLLCRLEDDQHPLLSRKKIYEKQFKKSADDFRKKAVDYDFELALMIGLFKCDPDILMSVPNMLKRDKTKMPDSLKALFQKHFPLEKKHLNNFNEFFNPAFVAKMFTFNAKMLSGITKNYLSPFHLDWLQQGGNPKIDAKGKEDDISAVVGWVDELTVQNEIFNETVLDKIGFLIKDTTKKLGVKMEALYDILKKSYLVI